jgi:hypothetical protein
LSYQTDYSAYRPQTCTLEEWNALILRDDQLRIDARERERAEERAEERRRKQGAETRRAEIAARRQAAPEYDWNDVWAEIDHRVGAAVSAAVASYREVNAELLDRLRDAEDKLRTSRHEIAELRGIVAQLQGQVAEAKERAKQSGTFPPIRQWVPESVAPEGSMWAHDGAAWQARVTTASEPKESGQWVCVSAPGAAGEDGRGFNLRGTWSPAKTYHELDVVAHNGGTWIARRDGAGVCPGEDWQCGSMPGKRGPAGESVKGDPGPRGEVAIIDWKVSPDSDSYKVAVVTADGAMSPWLDLRVLFERFAAETN